MELLVVISIIALLLAILLPALGKARDNARTLRCLSNQHQLGVAVTLTVSDHEGGFPQFQVALPGYTVPTSSPNGEYWDYRMMIDQYVTNPLIYKCPSFPESDAQLDFTKLPTYTTTSTQYYFNRIHYGYNYLHIGSGYRLTGTYNSPPAKLSALGQPANTLLTADAINYNESIVNGNFMGSNYVSDAPSVFYPAHARHLNAVAVLFADSHAAASGAVTDPLNPYTVLGNYSSVNDNIWDRR